MSDEKDIKKEADALETDSTTDSTADSETEAKTSEPEVKKHKFQANITYFTICIYAIATFCICLFIYKFADGWKEAGTRLAGIFSMLTPFLIAFLIAYFVNPLIRHIDNLLEKLLNNRWTHIHRVLSLIIAYAIVIGCIALVLTFIIPQVGSSIIELIGQAPSMYIGVERGVNNFISEHPDMNLEAIQQFVNKNLPNLFDTFQNIMTGILPKIYNVGLSLISWIINIILAFVISCYLMWDKDNLLRGIKRIIYSLILEKPAKKIITVTRKCNEIFSAFIIGKAIDSLIIGLICFILMCILQLPYAVLISVIVGITNMIPYFGPFIGAVPGGILLLIISPKQCLIFVIMIFLLQQFDGSILGPKILGESTGLKPIWIIFAITVGGYAAGVVGMFLGVPIIAVIAYLLNTFLEFILEKRHLSDEVTLELQAPLKPETSEAVPLKKRLSDLFSRNNKK